jgi:dipeptidyl aminopeptidase/acylaminoacyl peptidase
MTLPRSLTRRTALRLGAGAAVALAGCAGTPSRTGPPAPAASAAPADGALLLPNENLVLQGVPDIPLSLVRQVEKYTDFRGHAFVDWHPLREEMLVSHRRGGANTAQLFAVAGPLAEPRQLTDFPDPVTEASYEPREGRYLVFARSPGGSEADRLYRLDLETRAVTPLTETDERHEMLGWLRRSGRLLYTAVPLDRTAQDGSRANPATVLWLVDPLQPEGRRQLAELPGTGWFGGDVSRDEKTLALTLYRSANESQVWLIDLATGTPTQLLPAPGETLRATHLPAGFERDGDGLFVISDRAGEFNELMRCDLATRELKRATAHIPWDVESLSLSEDGALAALRVNADGREELRLFDARTLQELPAPAAPPGSVNAAAFHRRSRRLAVGVDGARSPNVLFALDPNAPGAGAAPWTRAYAPPGVDAQSFPEQRIVRWTSFDGLPLSAIFSAPPPRFAGRRPVVVIVHGGPEGQATLGFLGRWNYMLEELGIAVVQPNVRGSAGYGKRFLALDNGMKREDAVRDLGTLLDWIAAQPQLDPSRVLVYGGSYGGYMSLAASTHYAERIAGAIDVVGISNFVTFLEHTETYRRDLRRAEYGDERDPAMRAFLERISPLNNAEKIRKPLFVIQGRNDPRVPYTEAEQIVERVRRNGVPVWYLRAENEGHGFQRKENADYQFYAMVRFLQETLLK